MRPLWACIQKEPEEQLERLPEKDWHIWKMTERSKPKTTAGGHPCVVSLFGRPQARSEVEASQRRAKLAEARARDWFLDRRKPNENEDEVKLFNNCFSALKSKVSVQTRDGCERSFSFLKSRRLLQAEKKPIRCRTSKITYIFFKKKMALFQCSQPCRGMLMDGLPMILEENMKW